MSAPGARPGRVGEDAPGEGEGDRRGEAGEGKVAVLDQVPDRQAVRVGKFVEPTVQHQGEGGVGAPVVAGPEVGDCKVAEAKRPAADVEEMVALGHPLRLQDLHLGPRSFSPAAADDVTVSALGDGLLIEAGGEVGGGEGARVGPQLFGSFGGSFWPGAVAAAFMRARSWSFVSRGGVTDFGAPFWA